MVSYAIRFMDEALHMARVNLKRACTSRIYACCSRCGLARRFAHEAVGHGLEGDFNRKEASTFSGRIGEQVAAEVTVVDDGTLPDRRGSLRCDDEGTPCQYNVLIEDGILKKYMQDKVNVILWVDYKVTAESHMPTCQCRA